MDLCAAQLDPNPSPSTGSQFNYLAPPANIRSLMDDPSASFAVLKALVRSDKRCSKIISSHRLFLLDVSLTELPANMNVNNIHPMMLHNPRFLEANGRKAVAVENKTLLGHHLRGIFLIIGYTNTMANECNRSDSPYSTQSEGSQTGADVQRRFEAAAECDGREDDGHSQEGGGGK